MVPMIPFKCFASFIKSFLPQIGGLRRAVRQAVAPIGFKAVGVGLRHGGVGFRGHVHAIENIARIADGIRRAGRDDIYRVARGAGTRVARQIDRSRRAASRQQREDEGEGFHG